MVYATSSFCGNSFPIISMILGPVNEPYSNDHVSTSYLIYNIFHYWYSDRIAIVKFPGVGKTMSSFAVGLQSFPGVTLVPFALLLIGSP